MDQDEINFNLRKEKLDSFKSDLIDLALKHNITMDRECEYLSQQDDCDGICTYVYYVVINNERWWNDNFMDIIFESIPKNF